MLKTATFMQFCQSSLHLVRTLFTLENDLCYPLIAILVANLGNIFKCAKKIGIFLYNLCRVGEQTFIRKLIKHR